MGRKPYHKPTRVEEEARVAYTVHLLSRYAYKGEIKRLLKQRFGISARSCERYLARARELLRERTGADLDEHRALSLGFYESVIRDPATTTREQLLAQKRIDKLLGLEERGQAARMETDRQQADKLAALRQAALRDPESRELMARLAERLGGVEAPEMADPPVAKLLANLPGPCRREPVPARPRPRARAG
jgi:hypothetical protein